MLLRLLYMIVTLIVFNVSFETVLQGEDSFQKEVAPILEFNCVRCHNVKDAQGSLDLSNAKGFLKGGDSGIPITPGDDESSLLIDMVQGDQPEMPKGANPLKKHEISVIQKWINEGAKWPKNFTLTAKKQKPENWWSFKPIKKHEPPKVPSSQSDWARTPIDQFILAKLNEKGLTPSNEANRRTLIRRLYFDLIGLPPSPEEVISFQNDTSPKAYEKLVDKLLASKHYGERWARHWLDVVKYADTCGYDKDKLRPNAWPYRDYVIRSFNNDKKYSRFVKEQIAGDALFPDDPDGILGLGFIAAGPWDFIGHVEISESKIDGKIARNLDRDEMVSNTLNTFCSVTIQCARCHDHKFDPFTQKDYYSLQAIFAAVDRADRRYDVDKETESKRRKLERQLASLKLEMKQIEQSVTTERGKSLAEINKTLATLKAKSTPRDKNPAFGYHSKIASNQNVEKWVQVDLKQPTEITSLVLHPCHDDYAGIGAGFGFPIRFKVECSDDENFESDVQILADVTKTDFANPGLVPFAVNVDSIQSRFVRITAIKLAERRNDFIFALADLQVINPDGKNVAKGSSVTSKDSIEAPIRWQRKNLTDGIYAKSQDLNAAKLHARALKEKHFVMQKLDRLGRTDIERRIKSTQKGLATLPKGRMVYAASTSFKKSGNFKATNGIPRTIRILDRGNIQTPGEKVEPSVLPVFKIDRKAFVLKQEHTELDRRTMLARWLTHKENPLLWRSIVNRIWQYHFGNPLVDTPNDFGRMGAIPTHPELLDWLAMEFRDGDESFKKLHRLIVTSAVYRQSSMHDSVKSKTDSTNQYYWRMNRRRLEAEEIRDSILAVSGKLNRKMYGPGFYLFELEQTKHSPHYEYHKHNPDDPNSHRRSVYRFIVRSQPHPMMTTLDCADSSQSTPKRNETLTSLQALSMLNNKFVLAMSRHFADRIAADKETLPDQVARAFQLITSRLPTPKERSQMENYAGQHGLENLCRVLFNMSEFAFLD